MILPKTTQTIKDVFKNDILPAISNALPARKKKNVVNTIGVDDRITQIEDVLTKMSTDKQYSSMFDHYHQMNPSSISPNVLEQLYGRDLDFLRQYYRVNSPIDQLIFGRRFEQLRGLSDCVADNPKKVGWRVVHKQKDSPNFKTDAKSDKVCRFLEELISNPNKERHPGGFPDALVAMAESKMLFDRIPVEKLKHQDPKWGGAPASYLIPDAATIKPTTWALHAMAGSSGYSGISDQHQATRIVTDSRQTAASLLTYESSAKVAAKTMAKNKAYGSEMTEYQRLMSGIIVWVQQMPDRQISAGYTKDDICVFIGNPSPQVNSWGWSSGSAFERSFSFGEVIFKMTGLNKEIFDSRMPEGILAIDKSGVDKRKKQQLHERMYEEGSDRYSNLLIEFVNDPEKDIKYTKLKDKPTDMQFQAMFILYIKLKCSAYGLDYTELNLEDGKSGGLGGSGATEKRMDKHSAVGIHSDTRYYAHCLTDALIKPWSEDYKMEFVHDVTETEDEVKLKKEKMGYTSLFETRTEDNLEENWWDKAPKEFREELKKYGKFSYIPGLEAAGRVQLIQKQMEQDLQEKMQAQEAEQGENGEGPEEPKESKEITDLKSAIGQQESENEELEKSFAVKVEHLY